MVVGVLRETLGAESILADSYNLNLEFRMEIVIAPMRAFFLCTVLPSLSLPLGCLYTFGYARCLRTMTAPFSIPQPVFDPHDVQVVVHRRRYNPHSRKIEEDGCFWDADTINKGLGVAGTRRNEFVDDPKDPGVSYFVMERKKLNKRFMDQGQTWAYGFMGDFLRYGLTVIICVVFYPAAQRFHQDLFHWWRGQLSWTLIRHPIQNIFFTAQEYQKAKFRVNNKMPSQSRPWNYKL